MILFIGFIETIFIFLIGVLLGVCLSYELFSIELSKQLIEYDRNRRVSELLSRASKEANDNMKKVNGINIVEESDLINYDEPNMFYHEKEDGMDFICNHRLNIRFKVKEEDLPISISELIGGLNNGSIEFNLNFEGVL